MKINIEVNRIPVTVEADRYVDILDMHIEKLTKMIGHDLKTRMAIRNYVEVTIYRDDGSVWGSTLWIPPMKQALIATDGHERVLDFDSFIQIVEVIPGIPGLELEPISRLSPSNGDLVFDINAPTSFGFMIVAVPHITTEQFDWGFNGGNGLLAVYDQFQKHKMTDKDGYTRAILYHNHYMGYHFDKAANSTILRYYKPIQFRGNVL